MEDLKKTSIVSDLHLTFTIDTLVFIRFANLPATINPREITEMSSRMKIILCQTYQNAHSRK